MPKLFNTMLKKPAGSRISAYEYADIYAGTARGKIHKIWRIFLPLNSVIVVIQASGTLINKTITDIINSKNREVAGQTAPAHGLYLKKIDYWFYSYFNCYATLIISSWLMTAHFLVLIYRTH